MKIKYLAIIAAAAIAFAGCSEDFGEQEIVPEKTKGEMPENCMPVSVRFTGTQGEDTRTSLAVRNVLWAEGDQIGIFSPEAYYEWSLASNPDMKFYNNPVTNFAYRVAKGAGSSSATFEIGDYYNADVMAATGRWGWNTSFDTHNFYAYYPYSDGAKASSKYSSVAFTLPLEQVQTGNDNTDHVAAYDFLYAHTAIERPDSAANKELSDIDVRFAFKHAFVLLKINISNSLSKDKGDLVIKKIQLEAPTALSGNAVIDLATGAVTMGKTADASGNTVDADAYNKAAVTLGEGLTIANRKMATVYMIVNAADMTGNTGRLTVITDKGGKVFTVNKAMEAGNTYTKTVYLSSLDQYVTKTISFEDVDGTYLAGPTSYGENLYSSYTAGTQFTGYLDKASDLYFGINDWEGFDFWNGGFAISQWNDMTDGSYKNQCSVYYSHPTTKKGGNNGSDTFAVGFGYSDTEPTDYSYDSRPSLYFNEAGAEKVIESCCIANNTYVVKSVTNSDSFGKVFSYEDKDWFKVTAAGYDKNNKKTGEVEFYLADFRTADAGGVVTEWKKFDLSSLGAVHKIIFNCHSSDVGAYGMNTPAYFCIDDIVVREPFE